MKIIVTVIRIDLATNAFSSFCFLSFLTSQKRESGLWQVNEKLMVMRSISMFCLYRVALYFKAMQNSVDFYERISFHVIPIRIIAPWFL